MSEDPRPSTQFYCKQCDIRCESIATWSQHLSGKKHLAATRDAPKGEDAPSKPAKKHHDADHGKRKKSPPPPPAPKSSTSGGAEGFKVSGIVPRPKQQQPATSGSAEKVSGESKFTLIGSTTNTPSAGGINIMERVAMARKQQDPEKAEQKPSGGIFQPKVVSSSTLDPTIEKLSESRQNHHERLSKHQQGLAPDANPHKYSHQQQEQQHYSQQQQQQQQSSKSAGNNAWANPPPIEPIGGKDKKQQQQRSQNSGSSNTPGQMDRTILQRKKAASPAAATAEDVAIKFPAKNRQIPALPATRVSTRKLHDRVSEVTADIWIPKQLTTLLTTPPDHLRYVKDGWKALQSRATATLETEGNFTRVTVESHSLNDVRDLETFLYAMIEFAPYETTANAPSLPPASDPITSRKRDATPTAPPAASPGSFTVTSGSSPATTGGAAALLNFPRSDSETSGPFGSAWDVKPTGDNPSVGTIQSIWN